MGSPVRDPGTGQLEVQQSTNFTVADQSPAAATLTYLTGSQIAIPKTGFKIGSTLRWKFAITKTAAGSASCTFDVRLGTAGTTGDAAVLTFTKPAGTAAADEGVIEIIVTCRGPISATGKLQGEFTLIHNLAATGHAVIPVVAVAVLSSNVDLTVAALIAGITVTSGAADAITVTQLSAEALNI